MASNRCVAVLLGVALTSPTVAIAQVADLFAGPVRRVPSSALVLARQSVSRPPQVAVDGQTIHIAWCEGFVHYLRSRDGGRTFEPVRVLDESANCRTVAVTVDRDDLVLGWIRTARPGEGEWATLVSRLPAGDGTSFTPATTIPQQSGTPYGLALAAGGGRLHALTSSSFVDHQSSSDGGRTWSQPRRLADYTRQSFGNRARYVEPAVAAGPDGQIYAVWRTVVDLRWNGTMPEMAVYMARSLDDGATFSEPERLRKVGRGIYPSDLDLIDVGVRGDEVLVSWLDFVGDSDNGPRRQHGIRSTDAGVTWGPVIVEEEDVDGFSAGLNGNVPVLVPITEPDGDRYRLWKYASLFLFERNPLPTRTRAVAPAYPPEAERIRARGLVSLLVTIDAMGHVAGARSIRASAVGSQSASADTSRTARDAMVASAVAAARQWEFEAPGDGAAAVWMDVAFDRGQIPRVVAYDGVSDFGSVPGRFVTGAVRCPGRQSAATSQPVRDLGPPVQTKNVNPVYPIEARQLSLRGEVVLEAVVEIDGRITFARVIRGPAQFYQAAIGAACQWEFEPALQNGVPVPVVISATMQFTPR